MCVGTSYISGTSSTGRDRERGWHDTGVPLFHAVVGQSSKYPSRALCLCPYLIHQSSTVPSVSGSLDLAGPGSDQEVERRVVPAQWNGKRRGSGERVGCEDVCWYLDNGGHRRCRFLSRAGIACGTVWICCGCVPVEACEGEVGEGITSLFYGPIMAPLLDQR